jgi:NAD(P)-dependent dehydrogenase (short-subunit alcohol dehydrogenase family)
MVDMKDKVILITGATSGIGKSAGFGLAKTGAVVVIVARDKNKGEKVRQEIIEQSGNKNIHLLVSDLSLMRSVRGLAEEFKNKFDRLDVLINNAGGIFGKRILTEEGLEYTFALNHIAYFLLTNLLLDILKKSAPSRIINVASEGHRFHGIDLENLQGEKGYSGLRAYDQSKLCNILFTYELSRRLEETGVTANCLHPGMVDSNFGSTASFWFRLLVKIGKPILITPERAARAIIYFATSPEVAHVTGKYFIGRRPAESSKVSYNREIQRRLWEISESITGVKF